MGKSEEWDWLKDMFTYHIDDVEPLTVTQKKRKIHLPSKKVVKVGSYLRTNCHIDGRFCYEYDCSRSNCKKRVGHGA